MTDEAMSPLRRRMIEDMTVRKFVEKTQKDYVRHVKDLTAFLRRSPDTAEAEDLRRYQLHLTDSGARPPTINSAVSALRFFFSVTLDRPEVTKRLTFVAEPRRIPIVLSPEEVARFLEAAPGPKYKAALSAAYGAGLRVSEVVALKVSDIDLTLAPDEFIRRFLIHVLPDGFHRIRHYGLFANSHRAQNIARARQLLNVPTRQTEPSDANSADADEPKTLSATSTPSSTQTSMAVMRRAHSPGML